ncbi:MAG: GCN5-related N-acetyltransferase, partial [uncultured bacterium]
MEPVKEIKITPLQESDLSDLLAYANNLIDEDTFVLLSGNHLTYEHEKTYVLDAINAMKEKKKIHLIARIGGKLAASFEVRVLPLRKSHAGEIGISVAPEFRGSGVGKKCMEILIKEAKKLGLRLLVLTCFAINARAIHVYE